MPREGRAATRLLPHTPSQPSPAPGPDVAPTVGCVSVMKGVGLAASWCLQLASAANRVNAVPEVPVELDDDEDLMADQPVYLQR